MPVLGPIGWEMLGDAGSLGCALGMAVGEAFPSGQLQVAVHKGDIPLGVEE